MATLLSLLILPPLLFLIFRFKIESNIRKSPRLERILLSVYLILIVIFCATVVSKEFNIYIRGYRSTSILFIGCSFLGVVYWLVDREPVFTKVWRSFLFVATLVSVSAGSLLAFELAGDYKNQLIYNDPSFRLEQTGRWFINPCTLPTLYVKQGFFEKKYKHMTSYCVSKSEISETHFEVLSTSQVQVTYFLNSLSQQDIPNPLRIVYFKK